MCLPLDEGKGDRKVEPGKGEGEGAGPAARFEPVTVADDEDEEEEEEEEECLLLANQVPGRLIALPFGRAVGAGAAWVGAIILESGRSRCIRTSTRCREDQASEW